MTTTPAGSPSPGLGLAVPADFAAHRDRLLALRPEWVRIPASPNPPDPESLRPHAAAGARLLVDAASLPTPDLARRLRALPVAWNLRTERPADIPALRASANALRAAAPTALLVGPGLRLDDPEALDPLLRAGLWQAIDAVSVELPSDRGFAGTLALLRRLRGVIARHVPRRLVHLPVVVAGIDPTDAATALRIRAACELADIRVAILGRWDPANPSEALRLGAEIARRRSLTLRHRLSDTRLLYTDPSGTPLVADLSDPGFAPMPSRDPDLRALATVRLPRDAPVVRSGGDGWPTADVFGAWWGIAAQGPGSLRVAIAALLPGQEARRTVALRPGKAFAGALVTAAPIDRTGDHLDARIVVRVDGRRLPEPAPLRIVRADPLRLTLTDGRVRIDDPAGRGLKAILDDGATRRPVELPPGTRSGDFPAPGGAATLRDARGAVLARLLPPGG